jgi:hypothetical protein
VARPTRRRTNVTSRHLRPHEDRSVPSKRAALSSDLRTAARVPIAKRRLAEVLGLIATAPTGSKLWLGERWPWTPGTDAAIALRRPRWAVFAMDLSQLRRYADMDADTAVREMNRDRDPWPLVSRQVIPTSAPPRVEPSEPAPPLDEAREPSSPLRRK